MTFTLEDAEKSQNDLHAINLQILMLLRETANSNPTQAQVQFGLDRELCEMVANLDIASISRLSQMPSLVFRPRLPADFIKAAMTAASEKDEAKLEAITNAARV